MFVNHILKHFTRVDFKILLHTYTDFCNFPSCHATFLYVVKSNFVYAIDQVFISFAFLPVPPIIIITYLSAELEECPPTGHHVLRSLDARI